MAELERGEQSSQYSRLQEKYGSLLQKYQQAVVQRSHSHWLGSWLIHEAQDGVVLIRQDQIVVANRSFYALAASRRRWLPLGEPEGHPLPLTDCLLAAIEEMAESEVGATRHFRSLDTEGCLIEARLHPIERSPRQTAIVLRDLSDKELLRVQHEEAVRRDQFMATLAHELRNPLAPIISAAELIARGADPEAVRHAAEVILRQARHQARLVDDLLDAARVRQGKIVLRRGLYDLCDLVREAVDATENHRQSEEVRLELELPAQPVWADVDATRVVQCLVNLLVNAAKFTLADGLNRIELETDGDLAWIRVRDDGIGIDPPMLGHIFELFTQADESLDRNRGGLGLGLPLVRRLVELHGGGIRAASEGLGRGAVFALWLPIVDRSPAPDRGEDGPAEGAAETGCGVRSRLVLVVEDNADARETLCELLEASGLIALSAPDGACALEAVREFAPGTVVSDIGLPGLDGFELARRLHAENPDLRLIALSGYSQPEDRRRAEEAGFHAYFIKPVDAEALVRAITGPYSRLLPETAPPP